MILGFFYLSPAETGEILLSPAGSSIQLPIFNSSGDKAVSQKGCWGWDGRAG